MLLEDHASIDGRRLFARRRSGRRGAALRGTQDGHGERRDRAGGSRAAAARVSTAVREREVRRARGDRTGRLEHRHPCIRQGDPEERGDQAPHGGPDGGRGPGRALRGGGPDQRPARTSRHRPNLRVRHPAQRPPVPVHEDARGPDARRRNPSGGGVEARARPARGLSAGVRQGLRRRVVRPQPGRDSPRPQAGERHDERLRAGVRARLGHRAPAAVGRIVPAERAPGRRRGEAARAGSAGGADRDALLHGARAAARDARSAGRTHGRVRARGDPVSDPRGGAAADVGDRPGDLDAAGAGGNRATGAGRSGEPDPAGALQDCDARAELRAGRSARVGGRAETRHRAFPARVVAPSQDRVRGEHGDREGGGARQHGVRHRRGNVRRLSKRGTRRDRAAAHGARRGLRRDRGLHRQAEDGQRESADGRCPSRGDQRLARSRGGPQLVDGGVRQGPRRSVPGG